MRGPQWQVQDRGSSKAQGEDQGCSSTAGEAGPENVSWGKKKIDRQHFPLKRVFSCVSRIS